MTVDGHLTLQDVTLQPSGEWAHSISAWFVIRVAAGAGYWLRPGLARELGPDDVLILTPQGHGLIRASQLGEMHLELYSIQPQLLIGLLTVSEHNYLEAAAADPDRKSLLLNAREPLAIELARMAKKAGRNTLPMRCSLLAFWADALGHFVAAPSTNPVASGPLRDRLHQILTQMPQSELSACSVRDLAAKLHCSTRHLSRLFRTELGVPLRARQTELRLLRARQLLSDSSTKIITVAYESGYRHLGLFNTMFKKRFGVTPSQWRKTVRKRPPNPGKRAGNFLTVLIAATTLVIGHGYHF